jgi:hypothetical protein
MAKKNGSAEGIPPRHIFARELVGLEPLASLEYPSTTFVEKEPQGRARLRTLDLKSRLKSRHDT